MAIDDEEYLPGSACLGTPVRVGDGTTGAVALSFPRKRLRNLEDLGGLVKGMAGRIARVYALTI